MDEAASRAVEGSPDFGPPSRHPDLAAVRHEIAQVRAAAGDEVAAGARLRPLKRLVLRAYGTVARRQVTYNQAVMRALEAAEAILSDLEQQRASLRAAMATLEAKAAELDEAVQRHRGQLREISGEQRSSRSELMGQRALVEMVLREARRALPGEMTTDQLDLLSRALDARASELYEAFENRFRGSRDDIRSRLKVYVDDVVAAAGGQGPAVDIGCGRGEWLELMQAHDVPAYGVDTSDAFVAENRERGLDVRHEDALAHLRDVPEGSLRAVTAFHLVEHLPFDVVVELVDHAYRALGGEGLLIFETPNPTNIVMSASDFYIDPTHIKPVHPDFLQFLLTARGFEEVEIRWLHPVDWDRPDVPLVAGLERLVDDIARRFYGPQDYAVVGRRPPR